jgi:hypothetical protein
MFRRPPCEDKYNPDRYLRNIDDSYVFDATTGLYKPKTYNEQTQSDNKKPGSHPRFRIFTDPKRDWVAITVGVLTLIVVGLYTHYARKQWQEAHRTAEQAVISACAAKSAAETADATLKNSQAQWRIEERPYLFATPQGGFNSTVKTGQTTIITTDPQGKIFADVTVSVTNSGRSPATDVAVTKTIYFIGPTLKVREQVKNFIPKYNFHLGFVSMKDGITPISDVVPITREQLEYLKFGSWEFYVVGGVQYRDIFTPAIGPYETTYCWKVDTIGLPFAIYNPKIGFRNSIK